jgi:hypothetical protein
MLLCGPATSQLLLPTCCLVGHWLLGEEPPDNRGSLDTACHLPLLSLLAGLPLTGASVGSISLAPALVEFQVVTFPDLPIQCPQTAC